jgi:hypothetical protein
MGIASRLSDAELSAAVERLAQREREATALVLEMLGEGSLNLATVRLLAPQLIEENHVALLVAASRKSKRAVEELVAKHFPLPDVAATERPRASRGVARGSRDIPARVKRAVWLRDGGRCAFVGKRGRRCKERGFLEFDHVEPHGVGGEPTVGNVRLRCRAHNGHAAVLYYGASRLRKRAGDAMHATRSVKIVAVDRPPP